MSYSHAKVDEIYREFSRDLPGLLPPPTKKQLAMEHHVLHQVFTPNCMIVDLGGGLNPRNGAIARLGGSVTVIDIFEYDLAWSVGKEPEQSLTRRLVWYGTLFEKLGDNPVSGMIDWSLQRFPGLCGSPFLDFRKSS